MLHVNSRHSSARTPLRAILLTLVLLLAGTELRAQEGGLTIGLTAADREVIAQHILTMDDMRKFAAVSTRFAELAQRDSKVCALIGQEERAPGASADDRSIAARARALEAEPVTRAALQASGVTAREFVVIMLTYLTTTMDYMTRVTGRSLYSDPVKVNPANREFMVSRKDEIGELFESLPDPCP
jgi:hypothetical protein